MSKSSKISLVCALVIIAAVVVIGLMMLSEKRRFIFEESDEAVSNPMQGMYLQINPADPDMLYKLDYFDAKIMLLAYSLDGFHEGPLPAEKLSELANALQVAREKGIQVIFRAAYSFTAKDRSELREPEDIELMVTHIGQMADVINEYKDIIISVQAGVIGLWGEWHGSRLFDGVHEDDIYPIRNRIALCWLENLDKDIIVQLRTPKFVREAVDAGADIKRLGLHNDALLSTESDMGTYADGAREQELEWISTALPHGLLGGEMPMVSQYSMAENAAREFEMMNLTYLNCNYNIEVLESWKRQAIGGENAYDYILRRIGSRLWLSSAKVSARVLPTKGAAIDVSLELSNSGFAQPNQRLECYIVVICRGKTYAYKADTQLSGKNLTVSGRIPLPENSGNAGGFDVGVWLGYGEFGSGLGYTLANDGNTTRGAFIFSRYTYYNMLWHLEL